LFTSKREYISERDISLSCGARMLATANTPEVMKRRMIEDGVRI